MRTHLRRSSAEWLLIFGLERTMHFLSSSIVHLLWESWAARTSALWRSEGQRIRWSVPVQSPQRPLLSQDWSLRFVSGRTYDIPRFTCQVTFSHKASNSCLPTESRQAELCSLYLVCIPELKCTRTKQNDYFKLLMLGINYYTSPVAEICFY